MWANIGSVCWRERRGRRTVAVTCNMRQYQLTRTTADVVACGAGIAGIAAAYHLAVRFFIPPASTETGTRDCIRRVYVIADTGRAHLVLAHDATDRLPWI
jgi:hypothetical protein